MRNGIAIAAFTAASAVLQTASAADLPVKAPAPAAVAPGWTGFYVNGGAGYGLWAAETHTSVAVAPIPIDGIDKIRGGKGWLGRVGGGFDYQFTGHIVAGAFADFDFSSLEGSIHDPVVGLSADIKQTSAWAAGARAGWLVTPAILTYLNAGYSSAHFSSGTLVAYSPGGATPVGVPSGYATPAFTANGWFLGGGTEVSIGNGLFWRNEYRYAYYGNHAIPDLNLFSANATPRFNDINFRPTVQTFTTQLVYKFNPGAAVAPVFPPPAAPVAANWTGVYANAGLGYGLWAANETSSTPPGGLPTPTFVVAQRAGGKGYLGRVGGGYDRQFASSFVAGAFADFDFTKLQGNIEDTLVAGDIKQQWAWAAGARAGWLLTPDILGYINAGYTSTHFSSATMNVPGCGCLPFTGTTTPSFTRGGWFVGGGTEYALSFIGSGFFWRNEYRYAQYGTQVLTDSIPGTPAILNNISFRPAVQTVTTQLVYKFNTGL